MKKVLIKPLNNEIALSDYHCSYWGISCFYCN